MKWADDNPTPRPPLYYIHVVIGALIIMAVILVFVAILWAIGGVR